MKPACALRQGVLLEPYYLAPFIHWAPKPLQRKLLRRFPLWGWLTSPSPDKCREIVDEIRLLTRREMETLFPEAPIHRESFLGMTKSLLAMWRPEDAQDRTLESRHTLPRSSVCTPVHTTA